jgi:hypothetical protein
MKDTWNAFCGAFFFYFLLPGAVRRMAELGDDHKRFIVESLACYDTPTMIQSALKERFGTEVTLQGINYYNPDSAQGKKELAQKWKEIFTERRATFDSEAETIPIARLAFRLRRLSQMVDNPKVAKNPVLAAALLKQAAMDAGGMFTNRREISGPGGNPIEVTGQAREQAAKELDEWRKGQAANLPNLLSEPPP